MSSGLGVVQHPHVQTDSPRVWLCPQGLGVFFYGMGWIPLRRSEETWEDGSPVNADMVIIILITILVIINGVTADQEQGGERGVCQVCQLDL